MKEAIKALIKLVIKSKIPHDIRNRGRKNEHPLDHYIETIDYVLRTGIQWHELRAKLHYTTYHKKFILWSKFNIFKIAYQTSLIIAKAQNLITEDDLKNLYVDSSMVKNIRGHDKKGINHYDRGRKGNKVTVIVTSKGIPLAVHFDTSNIHDINLLEPTIDQINLKIIGSRIIADKGYISKKHKMRILNNKGHYLIYPSKTNQKIKLPNIQKKLLNKRNIVENFFAWVQINRRIRVRYESKLSTYMNFYYLALLKIVVNKIVI